jgi:uncharacterized integral membrane protein
VTAKRILSWIIGAPVAVLLVSFAVANRHWIDISFDPINKADPWLVISLPAYLLLFAGMFIGMIVGGFVVWARQGKWRKAARMAQTTKPEIPAERKTNDATGLVPVVKHSS